MKCLDNRVFVGLDKLKQLNLADNLFTCIDRGAFRGLYNIEEINLKKNYIVSIDERVFGGECKDDFQLSCKNATLSTYCNGTNALKILKYINLRNNRLTYIHPRAFISCISLQMLDLGENRLLTLGTSFLYTPGHKGLFMDSCNIQEIPVNTFICAPLLSEIYFNFNYGINKISLTILIPLKNLKIIHLSFVQL